MGGWTFGCSLRTLASGRRDNSIRAGPIPSASKDFYLPPILGQSGTSYWMSYGKDQALAYNSAAGGATGSIRVITSPDGLVHGRWNRWFVHSDPSVLEVWDSSSQGQGGGDWALVHGVGVAELMERNQKQPRFCVTRAPAIGGTTMSNRSASTRPMTMSSLCRCLGLCSPTPLSM